MRTVGFLKEGLSTVHIDLEIRLKASHIENQPYINTVEIPKLENPTVFTPLIIRLKLSLSENQPYMMYFCTVENDHTPDYRPDLYCM